MKYILLSDDGVVLEIIPDEDQTFPGIPLNKRYSADFIKRLLPVRDSLEVEQNWVYNTIIGDFSPPDDPASNETKEEVGDA